MIIAKRLWHTVKRPFQSAWKVGMLLSFSTLLRTEGMCHWKWWQQANLIGFWQFFECYRKAKKEFEKYCAPLLHLSGVSVTIIQTEMEGHARDLLENLPRDTDAIVVAGGDGTLSEVQLLNILFNIFCKLVKPHWILSFRWSQVCYAGQMLILSVNRCL